MNTTTTTMAPLDRKGKAKLRVKEWRKYLKENGYKIAQVVTRPEHINAIRKFAKELNRENG